MADNIKSADLITLVGEAGVAFSEYTFHPHEEGLGHLEIGGV